MGNCDPRRPEIECNVRKVLVEPVPQLSLVIGDPKWRDPPVNMLTTQAGCEINGRLVQGGIVDQSQPNR